MTTVSPPRWKPGDFQRDLDRAVELFRARRLKEPVDQYRHEFEEAAARVEDLLKMTDNLTAVPTGGSDAASDLLADPDLRTVLRYLAGPPISEDDLKTLADAPSLAPSRLSDDDATVERIMQVVHASLDIKRFPWMLDQESPDDTDRYAAVVASASLLATQRVQTTRRNADKEHQEREVRSYLARIGLKQVEPRPVPTIREAPEPGEFCGECQLARRKADIVVALHDGRVMPIECKVSNSALNSVKRLNNDAAAKAAQWLDALGRNQVVPAAVLSGVFNKHNLQDAQNAGLTIFWAHNLKPLGRFIRATQARPP